MASSFFWAARPSVVMSTIVSAITLPALASIALISSLDRPGDLEDDLELNRHSERQAGNPDDQPNRQFVVAEDVAKQIRSSIRNHRLIEEISRRRHKHTQANDTRDAIERTQVLARRGQGAQSRGAGRVASRFRIKLFSHPAKVLWLMVDHRQHSAQEKQIAGLLRFDVRAK